MDKTPSHSERSHSLLGGSSANRWLNCTGSVALLQTLPPKLVGDAALKGTEAHEYLETCLKILLSHKKEGIPLEYPGHPDHTLEEIIQETVQVIWEKVLSETITDKAYGLETKLTISKTFDMYGSIDFWVVHIDDKGKRCGVVFDFKYGYHEVPVEKNAQLAYYAVALQETLKRSNKSLDYVRTIIYQPKSEEPYKESKLTLKQIEDWKGKFLKAAKEILVDHKTHFKAGDWCKFCEGQSVCKTYKSHLNDTNSLSLLESEIDSVAFPPPETISDEDLVKIITYGEQIKKYIDSVKQYSIYRNLQGTPIPGTKCVYTKTRRKWKENTEEIVKELQTLTSLPYENLCSFKLKGITVIENELVKIKSRKEAKTLLDRYTEQSVASVKIVLEDAPGERIESLENVIENVLIGENSE